MLNIGKINYSAVGSGPVVGEEFFQSIDGISRDAAENIFEPLEWIDIVDFASDQEGIEHSRSSRPVVGAGKQVVLPSDSHRANGILHQVVVNLQVAIGGVKAKLIPSLQTIAQGLADGALWQHGFIIFEHPRFKLS